LLDTTGITSDIKRLVIPGNVSIIKHTKNSIGGIMLDGLLRIENNT